MNLAAVAKIQVLYPRIIATFQALVVESKPIQLPAKQLHPIALPAEEDEDVTAQGAQSKMSCHQTGQGIEGESHVDGLGADETFVDGFKCNIGQYLMI